MRAAQAARVAIKVLNDHSFATLGMKTYLGRVPTLQVAWWSFSQLVRHSPSSSSAKRPIVLISRLSINQVPSSALTQALARLSSSMPVIVLLEEHEFSQVPRLMKAGLLGFLEQDGPASELIRAIQAVWAGELMVSGRISKWLAASQGNGPAYLCPARPLTKRESAFLDRIAAGCSNKGIASELNLSRRTVENHRSALMHKLKIRSIAGLVQYAIGHGIPGSES
jgi:DNA-binding NarL/FixJ family response regulator